MLSASTLPYTPQVEIPAGVFLTDKISWIQITGTFTAVGGEDHIVIGNFHDNPTTNVQQLSGFYPGSYYYIDDVTVEVIGQAVFRDIPAVSPLRLLLLAVLMAASGAAVLSLRRGRFARGR